MDKRIDATATAIGGGKVQTESSYEIPGASRSVKRRCSGLQRRALCATAGRRQTVSLSYSVCDVSQLRSQRALGRLNGARGEERRDFPHQNKWLAAMDWNHDSRLKVNDAKYWPAA